MKRLSFKQKAMENFQMFQKEPEEEESWEDLDNGTEETMEDSGEEEDEEQKWDPELLIRCDSLVKIYKSEDVEVMALQGLDLEIKRGELMAVIGKSGSGKSTLMNMIGGLERPSAGKLYIDGRDLFALSDSEMVGYRNKTVGFVWQKSSRNLVPYMTAVENIEVPMYFTKKSAEDMRKRAMELLERVGMCHKKDAYPGQMSGGEQQRIAIAVALANEPDILLADEPTGAVDTKTSNKIQDLFRTLNKELGITIIIVTHDISLANKVGRVVMISDGKISTEKIMKEEYQRVINSLDGEAINGKDSHEEYSVLDKARRLQLNEEMLAAAGIDSNKVKVQVIDDKVVISKE